MLRQVNNFDPASLHQLYPGFRAALGPLELDLTIDCPGGVTQSATFQVLPEAGPSIRAATSGAWQLQAPFASAGLSTGLALKLLVTPRLTLQALRDQTCPLAEFAGPELAPSLTRQIEFLMRDPCRTSTHQHNRVLRFTDFGDGLQLLETLAKMAQFDVAAMQAGLSGYCTSVGDPMLASFRDHLPDTDDPVFKLYCDQSADFSEMVNACRRVATSGRMLAGAHL